MRTRGVTVVPAIWDDPTVRWEEFHSIIIRSTWDYHLRPLQFTVWLDAIAGAGTPVWNPVPILRWNMDKHYLQHLEARGANIPRTLFLEERGSVSLADAAASAGLDEVVVKPAVSASAWQTKRVRLSSLSRRESDGIIAQFPGGSALVQEFLPEIEQEGEWSLLFFGMTFSHAVRKRPKSGDFRVQEEHGGTFSAALPPSAIVDQARNILKLVDTPLLYARVDGIMRGPRFLLLELELLEPALYFDASEHAAGLFCARFLELTG
jgi:glutathione synthase/RimK-type ligase-like ATP-grasp enzyme